MDFSKSSNPIFGKAKDYTVSSTDQGVMTLNGTINKTAILLFTVIVAASYTWKQAFAAESLGAMMPWVTGGAIGGLVMALITVFKKEWAPYTTPVYAIFEGLFLGAFSAIAEIYYPGLVMQAVALTFGVFLLMLFAYRTGVIKPTKKFMMGLFAATGAIFLVYMLNMILSMFGIHMPMIHSNGIIGIGFSVVVVVIAALNLIIDFKMVEDGVQQQAPKFMEWYSAFGLMVTLIWLYIEIVNLLMKLQSRD